MFSANSVGPDRRSVASDLGLHCMPVSVIWDARHKWGNIVITKTCLFKYTENFTTKK